MSGRPYKAILLALAVALLFGVSLAQREIVRQRKALDLDRYTELKGAPPVLALTTVALGGFRGLISNLLWIRANDLQENDKYFEMVQLADWITKLEPHFTQVWLFESWNMAYNISVKFKDASDRWRWVQRGIELLRDDGLRFNEHDLLIYRELAGFFQHKMGANMDDAHMYYKKMWANDMAEVLGMSTPPDWDELINPKTPEQKKRADKLRDKYKLDPEFMKQVDERYGPMEWKLPEAHAVYWAARGLEEAKKNSRDIDPKDLITLRRMIYQSMQLSFQRGRLLIGKDGTNNAVRDFVPNLAIIPKVNSAYEQAIDEDEKNRDNIRTAHRNFVRDAVFALYMYNRQKDAIQWYRYLAEKYPDKGVLEGKPDSFPRNVRLDDYAIERAAGEIDSLGQDKARMILEGMERTALDHLAMDDDDRFLGMEAMAKKVLARYEAKIGVNQSSDERLRIYWADIRQDALRNLLGGELSPILAAQLRTKLGLPANWQPPERPSTNAPTTNAPVATPAPVG